ncbi:MAG TPA: immunoglobulin domain-containing protein [Opitutaceae bacterium]|nr:immunoglobulin domain-containing protein [Opitutaceae bacterium]
MSRRAITPTLVSITLAAALRASIQSDIGFTELKQEYGSALPNGSNLTALVVEAPNTSGNWAVNKTGELSSRNITFPFATTKPTAYSTHAQYVANNLCGATTSILPALAELKVGSVASYRNTSLKLGSRIAPATVAWDVENHSLVSNITTYNLNALQLLDYRIVRDQITVVVALENGTNAMQPLWGNNYNTIAVGTATGKHSRGGSNFDGSGRQKPDLVGTATYTSYATPVVTSAAGFLIAETKRTASLAAAKDPRVIKALLMAGATKSEFSTWSHTTAQPLDPVYGAGQVNIYNSYKALLAGRKTCGTSWLGNRGWDLGTSGSSAVYYFEVPTGQTMNFSTVLTWYRELKTTDFWTFTGTPANLNLRLHNSNSSFALGTVVAESASSLDNVEHIYCPTLPAGKYALAVTGPAGSTYGIAWNGILSGGDSSSTPAPAVIVAAPSITTQPASLSVTVGTSATFSVSATGESLSYQWYKDGSALSGATAATYTITSAATTAAGSYKVSVINSAGSVTSSAATLTVTALPPTVPDGSLAELIPTGYSARGQNGTKESVAMLFDHLATTKWLDFSGTTWVQVTLPAARRLESYSFTSGNDYPVRDPYNWTLKGSNDGVTWTTIETRTAQTFASRKLQRDFVLSATSDAFAYYRFEISCKSGSVTQLADIELWGY